ncbi:MAG: hypothetical protein LBG92_11880 [Prevotellaceae bacterium]|jgi:V/A-type H+-transporting ATPase subunit I|nr:hypothetical protein [Prevotellaceae bacterium]MDR0560857.1 hypothetical protein [Prevotellaceae bacterium]
MTKYSFLIFKNDFKKFLEQLQEAGMIHVESTNVEPDGQTLALFRKIDEYEKIYNELLLLKPDKNADRFDGNAEALIENYRVVREQMAKLDARIKNTEKEATDALPWGDFNRNDLDKLNISIRFYAVNIKQFDSDWANRFPLCEISRNSGKVYFAVLNDIPDFGFDLPEIKLPSASYSDLLEDWKKMKSEYGNFCKKLDSMAASAAILSEARKSLIEQTDFNIAELGARSEADGSLKLLSGWLPTDRKEKFEDFLESLNVVYCSTDKPEDGDEPPILLKNNKFARLFEPLTNLYSLPNYCELDPTAFFAPFFMMFFGFCLGDGGYGLIIFLTALILKLKIKNPDTRRYLSIAQWLGIAGMFFGFVTATFLGISINEIKLDRIVEEKLDISQGYGMLYLSLLLGFVQIIFGMCLKVMNIVHKKGIKYALYQIGWIIIILGGIALYVIDNQIIQNIVAVIFGLSVLIAFLYNSPGKNPLINIGGGLWNAYNTASGLLGDILSYIRLYALGMTGGVLGEVFNEIAISAGDGINIPVVAQIATLIILLLGHGLNFMLGIIGAIVHPIRLTFVEFYKNAGFEGDGLPFKIFGKIN